jgi:hypothetical protein
MAEENVKTDDISNEEKVIEKVKELYKEDGGKIILIGNVSREEDGNIACSSMVNIDKCSNSELAQFINGVIGQCDGVENSLISIWEKELATGFFKNRKTMIVVWLLKKLLKYSK